MILSKKPLSLAEVKEYAKEGKGNENLLLYLKKFGKISKEKAVSIKEAIEKLNNPKIREEQIIKVADFMPQDEEDMNKIFSDSNLNEGEARALVEIVRGK